MNSLLSPSVPARLWTACLVLLGLAAPASAIAQVFLGQTEDFQSGAGGWTSGFNHPSPPTVIADAGPLGAGDDALQVVGTGGSGAGRTIVALNDSAWSGDFISAGVTGLKVDLRNVGASDLTLRMAFLGSDLSTWYSTAIGYTLPSGGGWQTVTFSLQESDLVHLVGSHTYEATFGDVIETRLLHSSSPNFRGDSVVGTLLVDHLTAIPEVNRSACLLGLALAGWVGGRMVSRGRRNRSVAR